MNIIVTDFKIMSSPQRYEDATLEQTFSIIHHVSILKSCGVEGHLVFLNIILSHTNSYKTELLTEISSATLI